jgi:hypothetical protein
MRIHANRVVDTWTFVCSNCSCLFFLGLRLPWVRTPPRTCLRASSCSSRA